MGKKRYPLISNGCYCRCGCPCCLPCSGPCRKVTPCGRSPCPALLACGCRHDCRYCCSREPSNLENLLDGAEINVSGVVHVTPEEADPQQARPLPPPQQVYIDQRGSAPPASVPQAAPPAMMPPRAVPQPYWYGPPALQQPSNPIMHGNNTDGWMMGPLQSLDRTHDYHGYARLVEDPNAYVVTSVFPKTAF